MGIPSKAFEVEVNRLRSDTMKHASFQCGSEKYLQWRGNYKPTTKQLSNKQQTIFGDYIYYLHKCLPINKGVTFPSGTYEHPSRRQLPPAAGLISIIRKTAGS